MSEGIEKLVSEDVNEYLKRLSAHLKKKRDKDFHVLVYCVGKRGLTELQKVCKGKRSFYIMQVANRGEIKKTERLLDKLYPKLPKNK